MEMQTSIVVTATAYQMACHSLAQLSDYSAEEWEQLIEVASVDAVRKFTVAQITEHLEHFEKLVEDQAAEFAEVVSMSPRIDDLDKPDNWDELHEQFKAEQGNWIPIKLDPEFCLGLIGTLQLALRHPANNGPTSDLVRQFTHTLIGKLAARIPACREICMKGFDPRYDQ